MIYDATIPTSVTVYFEAIRTLFKQYCYKPLESPPMVITAEFDPLPDEEKRTLTRLSRSSAVIIFCLPIIECHDLAKCYLQV
jgi:hypothetical protein